MDFLPAVFAERDHPFTHGEFAQFRAASAALDRLLQARGHQDDLEECGAAGIPALAAMLAADRPADLVRPFDGKPDLGHFFRLAVGGLGAVLAEPADEALGDEGADGRPHKKRFDVHIQQAGDPSHRIVGMEGAEDQVACEGGPDGDLGGLVVAHLADHDHVRVAAQDASQGSGEREVDLRLHGDLDHAVELVFDRILDRDDPAFLDIEAAEKRVKRRALAAAGRAGDEHDAVGDRDQVADPFFRGGVEPEPREIEVLLPEQAQADIFAVDARDRGHAHIDCLAGVFERDPSVLGKTPFGDVESRHDLEARDHGILEHLDAGGHRRFVEHAIDAVADAEILAERFKVDVGRPLLETLAEDLVHELHDRGLAVLFVDDIDFLPGSAGFIFAALDEFLEGVRTNPVGGFQCFDETPAGGEHEPHGARPMLDDSLPAAVVERVESQEAHLPTLDRSLGKDGLPESEPGGKFLADVFDDLHFALFPPREVE